VAGMQSICVRALNLNLYAAEPAKDRSNLSM
jgi:hypothetical protein